MIKLNHTIRILLAGAAQREDSSLLPLPASLKSNARTTAALAALTTAGFAIERETSDAEAVHRSDGDLRYGLYTTPEGLAAIGIEDAVGHEGAHSAETVEHTANDDASPPARTTKKSLVLDLLHRADGVTLPELVAATDWLPHTTRAALTGLRKAGHVIDRAKRGDDTCYRIVAAR